MLCVRDRFTGLFAAYPAKDRSTDLRVSSLRRFMGRMVSSQPVSLVSDAADEFESAAKILGWIPAPSLQIPRSSQHEREIRSFQEGVRSSFLEAGFAIRPDFWPVACRYGSMALKLSHSAPADSSFSRRDFGVARLGADDIPVKKLILGQLVFYRSKSEDKFSPNAKPGLFAGWRNEPGFSYRMVTYVLDLAKVKRKSGAWDDPFSVPEAELYVREGNPVFPLKNAAEQSLLKLGSADPSFEVPDPLPLPFSFWSVYVTYSRFLELGPAPGCSACENDRPNHSPECVARFERAFGRPEEGGSAASAPPRDPEALLSFERFNVPDVVPRADEDDFVERAAADIMAGIKPARRIADDDHYEPSFAADYDDPLDDFEEEGADAPAVAAQQIPRHKLPGALVLCEFCCDQDSMLGKVGKYSGIQVVRLCKEQIDLEAPGSIEQLIDQVSATPGCALHGALECKSRSAWSRLNAAKHHDYLQRLEEEREQSSKLRAERIPGLGGG